MNVESSMMGTSNDYQASASRVLNMIVPRASCFDLARQMIRRPISARMLLERSTTSNELSGLSQRFRHYPHASTRTARNQPEFGLGEQHRS